MRLVIFDADGTLINSRAIILEGIRLVFVEFGYPVPPVDATLTTIGLSLDLLFAELLDRPVDEEIKAMSLSYKKRSSELQKIPELHSRLYDGIDNIIHKLSEQPETLLAIATGKSRRGLINMIDAYGYRDKFIVSRTADDCPSKPHPAMILECCEFAGCEMAQSVMIGDSSYDMQMAIQAGAKAIGVSWGYQPVCALEKSGAHAIVDQPRDIPDAIDEIFKVASL
jgi:phosphoglycolate phosphatase